MRLLLVGALAALAVALPTGYHRKPSANERSELHRRAAARWLNMEKMDATIEEACATLYEKARTARSLPRKNLDNFLMGVQAVGIELTQSEAVELFGYRVSRVEFEEHCHFLTTATPEEKEKEEISTQAARYKKKIDMVQKKIDMVQKKIDRMKRTKALLQKQLAEKLAEIRGRQRRTTTL